MSIGTRIRQARNTKGYSQRYMAERLAISQNTYHRIENDEVKVKAEDLLKIAQELDADVNELLKDKQIVYNIKQQNNHDHSINGLVFQQESFDKERKLYEQMLQSKEAIIQDKEAISRGKDEIIRSKEAQIEQLNQKATDLLKELEKLK